MFPDFEKRIALAFIELFEIENILVKRHRLLHIRHLDGHVIDPVNADAHVTYNGFAESVGPASRKAPTLSALGRKFGDVFALSR
jgi:hypothetical protein